MAERPRHQSPLALVLLASLSEEPMHAYRMRRLIKERGKDRIVNVARSNSVYQTINWLRQRELVRVRETSHGQGRPDRTIYEITEKGRDALQQWLATTLSTPAREFPEFPAALASMAATTPEEVTRHLEERAAALTRRLAETEARRDNDAQDVPRLFLIEDEYLIAMTKAELRWVESLIAEITQKELTWTREWLDTIRSTSGE
ncbi:PadR family transcriptional regulator [Actinomadura madurae]|uniref:PadR family transcriptional regulator n=1 Tax=Actinomadura madurae TaxID=1993 RepID=UPI002026E72A|nr:helix-turn-helix transcriptional regulator [Actinomadura madurae]URN06991.1 PadR family transcriptional regulator [Actinomadura madurae]